MMGKLHGTFESMPKALSYGIRYPEIICPALPMKDRLLYLSPIGAILA